MGFQIRATAWAVKCFGSQVVENKTERSLRFIEEALELAQACGLKRSDVNNIMDRVYSNEVGSVPKEVGGVMVTLGTLCTTFNVQLETESERELSRCEQNVELIRERHSKKVQDGYAVI